MNRLALCLAGAALLAGCPSPQQPPNDDARATPEQATSSAAAPATGGAAPKPAGTAPAAPAKGTAAAAPATATATPATPGPGTTAAPIAEQDGACQKDSDCPGGQVCEPCRGSKCCTPGCRNDTGCPKGQHCKAVQCIRAPCPSLCQ